MLPDAARTLALVIDVHSGEPWHAFSTTRILDGVAAPQAAAHPAGGAHSIWEIVLHMTGWTREVAARLGGKEPSDPAEGDWPEAGDPTPSRWQDALAALDAAQRELADAAARVPDERWHQPVGGVRDPALGTGKTLLETLEGVALHHAYHAGQVALLKRASGARS